MRRTDTPRVALIQFPGSNCEWETKAAAEAAGISCDVFRWNRDPEILADYDGYIIGGGFSYQDRVRSGAIACKEPIVARMMAEVTGRHKPVIGICNGAQVLVEAGLIPGVHTGNVEMALAPNRADPAHRIAGFCCRWVHVRLACDPQRCIFTRELAPGEVIPIPIAHGEGRFTTEQQELIDQLEADDQIVFQYCDAAGKVEDRPDINPNGAAANIAGLCNPEGTVLAMMPHPERASFLRQVPADLGDSWSSRRRSAYGDALALERPGPGLAVFVSMRGALLAAQPA
ncbi:MAG TPA: phosphoribosylformylglycinamidine synthase I [Armatimonadota bacterium]|nr:phosphoribosylformylglycinamidine synthase I [Armatimonadota bacterium]